MTRNKHLFREIKTYLAEILRPGPMTTELRQEIGFQLAAMVLELEREFKHQDEDLGGASDRFDRS